MIFFSSKMKRREKKRVRQMPQQQQQQHYTNEKKIEKKNNWHCSFHFIIHISTFVCCFIFNSIASLFWKSEKKNLTTTLCTCFLFSNVRCTVKKKCTKLICFFFYFVFSTRIFFVENLTSYERVCLCVDSFWAFQLLCITLSYTLPPHHTLYHRTMLIFYRVLTSTLTKQNSKIKMKHKKKL